MTLPAAFEVVLDFRADWHIGTGQGRRGSVDAEVRRDDDKLPFVPAKSLIGVWRDACETVAETFDRAGDRSGAWQEWARWLFGAQAPATSAPAALRVTPARVEERLRAAVRGRPALAQAAVVLRPGVKIDDATGTATDRHLRVEERAIRGLRLHARCSLDDPPPEPAELLLRAGARLIEGIGGNRNRGGGRVIVRLPGVPEDGPDPILNRLLAAGPPGSPPPPPPVPPPPAVHDYGRLRPGGRHTVRLILRVETPVVAAAGVLGNVVFSRDSVPGTVLLGSVLSRLEPTGIGLADIVVGDAVPAAGEPGDATPAYPAPAVWFRSDKGRGPTVSNRLAHGSRPDRAKPMSGRVAPDGDGWRHVTHAVEVATHAVVDDVARKPTVASGGVYTYLGIAPGTLLCSDVVLPAGARLRLEVGERLRLGRSRKDDFGLVTVIGVTSPPVTAPPPVTDTLHVWCRSDVLLRDERLAPDPSPGALARTLDGLLAPATFTVADHEAGVTRGDGFGVRWGRPRPSRVALQAGGVVTLAVTGTIDPERLAALARDGIGERTTEGYGQVSFNPSWTSEPHPAVTFGAISRSVPSGTEEFAGDTHPIEINAWRRAIRRAGAEITPDELLPGISGLGRNRAQLGVLSAQLERLGTPGGEELVRTWLTRTHDTRRRRESWTKTLLDDLTNLLLDDESLIWSRLGLDGEQRLLVLGPGREDPIRDRLRLEALTSSFTDVLRRLRRDGSRT